MRVCVCVCACVRVCVCACNKKPFRLSSVSSTCDSSNFMTLKLNARMRESPNMCISEYRHNTRAHVSRMYVRVMYVQKLRNVCISE